MGFEMQLGVSMWSYVALWRKGAMDIPGFIRAAKAVDVDGVELLDFFWKDRAAEIGAVERALAESGLPVGVYSVANNFVNVDPEARAAQVTRINDGVDNAVHFGAKTVRVFAGNRIEGMLLEQAFDWIVDGLRAAAAYAKDHGVVLALENHGHLAGRSNQVLHILEAVGSSALRANPDTGNFLLVHQVPHDEVKALASHAAMVHLKDFVEVPADYKGFAYTSLDSLKYKGVALGEGDVALEECIKSLKLAGFTGWVNIEYEGEESPTDAVARSVATARRIMEKSADA